MKTIEDFKKDVAEEKGAGWYDFVPMQHENNWEEVCKRYAIEVTKPITELLAVMHGDGGHYTAKHGLEKSIIDAMELLHTKWKSPDQVRDACKATLRKAAKNACSHTGWRHAINKSSITDEQNIVL